MAGIFGHLNISDSDRVFRLTVGQDTIWQAAQEYVARANADLEAALSVFVERTTSDYKWRYKLPGGGHLQRRGSDGRYGSVKATGQWDVAFPLEDLGAQISGNDVDMAYMTAAELERHIQTVVVQNANTVRYELMRRLLNDTQRTFIDPLYGSLLVEPVANGDAVVYPPVLGSEDEATDNHFLESGYAAADISDTNNPYETIANELEEHFGAPTGGSNIVAFINQAQVAKTRALTDFNPLGTKDVRYGDDTDLAGPLPGELMRVGRALGIMEGSGVWVSEWRYLPANYILAVHLDAPRPLIRRIDPDDTGLGDGLQLVAQNQEFPFEGSFWRHRFGFGVGNRLNGVVMELGTGGTYTIPSGFTY